MVIVVVASVVTAVVSMMPVVPMVSVVTVVVMPEAVPIAVVPSMEDRLDDDHQDQGGDA